MNIEDLILSINETFLSGGGRTKAANVRSVMDEVLNSYINVDTGGYVQNVLTGYSSELPITDNKAFAHKKYVDDLFNSISADVSWGDILGTVTDQNDLVSYLEDNYLKLDGTLPMEGDLDLNANDILGITNIYDSGNLLKIGVADKILYNDWIVRGSGSTGGTHAMEWQNSGSGVLGYIRNDGYLKMMGGIYIENAGGAASQYNAVSTGSGTGDYSSYSLTNNSSDVGQLFLTSSAYNPIPFIGARALVFYNNGSGGIAIAADGGNIRFAAGGTTENFIMSTGGVFTANGGLNSKNGLFYSNGNLNLNLDDANINFNAMINAGNGSSGTNNIRCGNYSGALTSGDYNNLFGTQSLYNAGTSNHNNCFGLYSGYLANASFCNFLSQSSGQEFSGNYAFFAGIAAGQNGSGNEKFGIGTYAGRLNTQSNVGIYGSFYDIYFNHDIARDALGTSTHAVTLQTGGSKDGTNESASASILKFAAAKGTGNAAGGNVQFLYAVQEASGTTRQSLGLAAEMDGSTGDFKFEKKINLTLTDYATNALAIVGGLVTGDLYQTTGVVMIVY